MIYLSVAINNLLETLIVKETCTLTNSTVSCKKPMIGYNRLFYDFIKNAWRNILFFIWLKNVIHMNRSSKGVRRNPIIMSAHGRATKLGRVAMTTKSSPVRLNAHNLFFLEMNFRQSF